MIVDSRWALIHRKGCGQVALFIEQGRVHGVTDSVERIEKVEGGGFTMGEILRCGSCGRDLRRDEISPDNLQLIGERGH